MWIVMVSMVSGCLMYTVLVANATTMIANVDPAAKEYKSKVTMDDPNHLLANIPIATYLWIFVSLLYFKAEGTM